MSSTPVPSNWDRSGVVAPLNNMSVTGTPHDTWVLDSGTTSHMSSDDGILHLTPFRSPYHVMVGNSSSVPISRSHRTSIHTPSGSTFHLNNVLIVSSLAHNLISIRKFTRTTLVLSNLTPLVFLPRTSKLRVRFFAAIVPVIFTLSNPPNVATSPQPSCPLSYLPRCGFDV